MTRPNCPEDGEPCAPAACCAPVAGDQNSLPFKVGHDAYYRAYDGTVDKGSVIQIEGGPHGDLTEVFWPRVDQALWFPTNQLWHTLPPHPADVCRCGCTFGQHTPSGCVAHQLHRFMRSS